MYTNNEWSVENVWNMTQLTTQNDVYQRRLKAIQKEVGMIKHLALSSGEQEEEMIQLREEIGILKQQLEDSQQEVRRSNATLKEMQVQLQETQALSKETQIRVQVYTLVVHSIFIIWYSHLDNFNIHIPQLKSTLILMYLLLMQRFEAIKSI